MSPFIKPVKVFLEVEAELFFNTLPSKTKSKFLKLFDKTEFGLRGEWFEPLKETDGICEFRLRFNTNYYRLLAFWDRDGEVETLIVATHGFLKKTNKTPVAEIKRAESIKHQYFHKKKLNK